MTLLSGERIGISFGGLAALSDLTFEIRKGEIIGLIGPNGAGKTTLINVITGFQTPDRGTIRFNDEDITGRKAYLIGRLGIARTFQIVRPFSGMTVEENVLISAFFGKTGRKRGKEEALDKVRGVLEFVGLRSKKDVFVEETTIPDRKRLELAKALAMDPELLLLDEVMAGLRPTEMEEVMALLRELNRGGMTILLIEHVMRAIMGISHRVIVLHEGKLIADGSPREISEDERVIKAYLGPRYALRNGMSQQETARS